MYYIEKLTKFTKRDITLMHVAPVVLVFLAFLGITLWNWQDQKRGVAEERAGLLTKNIENTQEAINGRMHNYLDIINSGVGLFDASDYVSKEEWGQFVGIFNLTKRYPGVNSVGFVKVTSASEIDSYTNQIRQKEYPKYTIHPSGLRPVYGEIVYTQPKNPQNLKVVGYDMYTNSSLRQAMFNARDSGEQAYSHKLTPDKNGFSTNQPILLVFSPVYIKNSRVDTVKQRRQHILGYVYAEVNTYRLVNQFFDSNNPNFAFQIYEGEDRDKLIYQSPNFASVNSNGQKTALSREFPIGSHSWTIHAVVNPQIIPLRDSERPSTVLWAGILFSAFLAGFIYLLLLNRTRALTNKETREIQSAKDELLALASHQLRTPATGVKQYVGMLREGYGGKITLQQKKFLDKAYDSNERQLNIINDMLFVARADAGNIEFHLKKIDMLVLTKSILREQAVSIKENQHKLVRKLANKPVYVNADRRYLRMAIENLISNAIKYTQAGGTITVTLKRAKSQAVLTVEDTGVGVKKSDLHLLFVKFSRIPNDLSNTVSGSGIGLYLAKKVIEAHHGDIEFRSPSERGSRCNITLPLLKIRKHKR